MSAAAGSPSKATRDSRRNEAARGRPKHVRPRYAERPLSLILDNKWSLFVLGEACRGATRFNQFKSRLGVTPVSLVKCLSTLVNEGILTRRAYSRSRWEYVLTDEGETIRPAITALLAWDEQCLAERHAKSRPLLGSIGPGQSGIEVAAAGH